MVDMTPGITKTLGVEAGGLHITQSVGGVFLRGSRARTLV